MSARSAEKEWGACLVKPNPTEITKTKETTKQTASSFLLMPFAGTCPYTYIHSRPFARATTPRTNERTTDRPPTSKDRRVPNSLLRERALRFVRIWATLGVSGTRTRAQPSFCSGRPLKHPKLRRRARRRMGFNTRSRDNLARRQGRRQVSRRCSTCNVTRRLGGHPS